jgi:hypothetical protein
MTKHIQRGIGFTHFDGDDCMIPNIDSKNGKGKPELLHRTIDMMGVELEEYKWKSCIAQVGTGKGWATVYSIESGEQGKGHAQELLKLLKYVYRDVKFGGTVALNPAMAHIYKKLGIKEYA